MRRDDLRGGDVEGGMMAADELVLKEFESLTSVVGCIPHRSQRSLFASSDVDWTSFDASDDLFVVGTKSGTLFVYDRTTKTLKHNLVAKERQDEITKLKIIRSIDTVVAAGRASGSISIFQLLSMSRGQYEEVRVFLITDIHHSTISCLEWSQNAMKLFSGDNNGVVACTEIDYLLNSSKSYVVHRELPEGAIVQLNYNYRKLLVSSLERSFIVHMDDGNKVSQIGKKQRKRPGTFGAVFMPGFLLAKDAIIYAARPGLRLWKARTDGAVEQTHLFQDNISAVSLNIHPLHEIFSEMTISESQRLHQFGPLYVFRQLYLLSFQGSSLYVVDPVRNKVVCYHSNLGEIIDVAVNKDEVFVLRKTDVEFLIRLSDHPNALDSATVKDTQKLSQSPVSFASDISPPQVVRKFGQTAAKMTENIATKVIKEVGEKLQSVPRSIPVWVQYRMTKNELDRNEFHVKANNTDEMSNANGRVGDVSLDESKKNLKNFVNNVEIDRNRNICRSLEDVAFISSAENVPVINTAVSVINGTCSAPLCPDEDLNRLEQHTEENSFSICKTHSVVEIHSPQVFASSVKHSSSVSEFHILHDAVPDDEIVFSRAKRSRKRRSTKATSSLDTVSLASFDSMEFTSADSPVMDSSHGDSHSMHESPVLKSSTENGVMDTGSQVSDTAAVELREQDENMFDIDIDLLRNDEPLYELISVEVVSHRLSENNSAEKTDDKKRRSGCSVLQPASSDKNAVSHDDFYNPGKNNLPNGDQDHLSENFETFLTNEDSIYSCSKSFQNHNSQKFNGAPKVFQYSEQQHSIITSELFHEHDSDRVSLQDALEFSVIEENSKKTTLLSFSRTEMTPWREFSAPARLSSISISSQHIWCTDDLHRVHYSGLSGQGLRWQTLQQTTAQQIAVSPSGFIVWRLDRGTAFAAMSVSKTCPSGVGWVEVARDVAYIAVDDSEAWYVKTNGEVAIQKDLSRERPCYKSCLVPCSFKMAQVSCRSGVVCGITSDNSVVVRHGVTRLKEEGTEWTFAEWSEFDHIVCRFDFGENGTAWVFDLLGRLWYSTGFSSSRPEGDGMWWQVSLNSFLMSESNFWDALKSAKSNGRRKLSKYLLHTDTGLLAAKLNGLWICPRRGSSLHFCPGNVVGYSWRLVSPINVFGHKKWKLVSATGQETGQSGLVWLVDSLGSMFCFIPSHSDGVNLISVDPPEPREMCQSFSASVDVAWCVLGNGNVYIRRQMAGHCLPGYGWDKVDMVQIGWGKLVHVSVGNNVVWGVHSSGAIYLRIGVRHRPKGHILNPAWLKLDDHYDRDLERVIFKQVFTAPDDSMVWATDLKNRVYIRIGVSDSLPIGLSWQLVEGTHVDSMCLSSSQVYATTPGGDLIRRVGITRDRPKGDYWQTLPGSFHVISVTVKDELWAIDKDGDLYRQEVNLLERPLALDNLTEGHLLKCMTGTIQENDWIVY